MRLGILSWVALAALLFGQPPTKEGDRYPSPDDLAISSDGKRLYVVCTQTDELLALDPVHMSIVGRVHVGRVPRGVALDPAGKHIYVTNSWSDTVSEIDAGALRVEREIPTSFEPAGVVVDGRHGVLYVANRLSNDLSLIDLRSGRERRRLLGGRGASYLAISADYSQVFVTHIYPKLGDPRSQPASEIMVVDTEHQAVDSRLTLHNAAGVFHVVLSRDGRLGLAAELRPKNLIPLARVEHGWAMGNSLSVFGAGLSGAVQLPLDEIESYFSLPFGVAIASHNSRAYLSASGSNEIAILDLERLVAAAESPAAPTLAYDLTASARYVRTRIPVGRNPRTIVLSPDGTRLYVANRLDDTISVVDVRNEAAIGVIGLGGPADLTAVRRGERIFKFVELHVRTAIRLCQLPSGFDLRWLVLGSKP
jgi:YVTN family beta-propeller protein